MTYMIRVIRTKNGWVIYPAQTSGEQVNVEETQKAYVATSQQQLASIISSLTF
jgi:hypothetical protein